MINGRFKIKTINDLEVVQGAANSLCGDIPTISCNSCNSCKMFRAIRANSCHSYNLVQFVQLVQPQTFRANACNSCNSCQFVQLAQSRAIGFEAGLVQINSGLWSPYGHLYIGKQRGHHWASTRPGVLNWHWPKNSTCPEPRCLL